jgi:creatinine amidohydrolase
VNLADLTSTELAGRRLTLLLPLGSTEQHGPHLPLDTDTRIACAVAEGAARQRADTVVAPALAYGASGEHAGFAGTLSLGTEALRTALVELVRSAGEEFGVVVFVNGHGGNADAVTAATDVLRAEGRCVHPWWPRPGGDAHAGHTETSLLLAICPEAVRFDRLEPGNTETLETLAGRLRRGGLAAVSPNGVLGDPRTASAEHGRAVLAGLVDDLVAHLP